METFTREVLSAPGPGSTQHHCCLRSVGWCSVTWPRGCKAAWETSLVPPSRGGKGCGERLARLLAGRRCVCGFSMGNSAEHRVENEYILLNE